MARKTTAKSTSGGKAEITADMRIVILQGSEVFLRDRYTADLRDALRERFGDFAEFSFDGRFATIADLMDELRSYGLLQEHKLVILDAADEFVAVESDEEDSGKKPKKSPKRIALENYAANPVDSATLLIRADTWRPSNIDKLVQKSGGILIKCEEPSVSTAVTWCVGRCKKEYGAAIDRNAAELLVARIGTALGRLDKELAKLASSVSSGETGGSITPDVVNLMVEMTREEKGWIIQSALLSGDAREALHKLRELLSISRQPIELVTWSMLDLARKLHGASQMLRQGAAPGHIGKTLRLWGADFNLVLAAARKHPPAVFARLFDIAVAADEKNKSGVGDPVRNLESLAVLVTDTVR